MLKVESMDKNGYGILALKNFLGGEGGVPRYLQENSVSRLELRYLLAVIEMGRKTKWHSQ